MIQRDKKRTSSITTDLRVRYAPCKRPQALRNGSHLAVDTHQQISSLDDTIKWISTDGKSLRCEACAVFRTGILILGLLMGLGIWSGRALHQENKKWYIKS